MVSRVQNAGLARITTALAALSWWLQWGTGSAAAAAAVSLANTAGTTEARQSASTSTGTTTVIGDRLTLTATITAAGSRAITEVGAFDALGSGSPPTGGNMNIYADFSVINLVSGDSIAFTLNTTFS